MTWDELLQLLQSYKAEGANLSGIVRLHSTESLEPLDLVESATSGNLCFIARWDTEETADE